MIVFKPGDRVVYFGTMTPNRTGKTGTVTGHVDPSGHCKVDWDDGARPFSACLAINLDFEELDLSGDDDEDCI